MLANPALPSLMIADTMMLYNTLPQSISVGNSAAALYQQCSKVQCNALGTSFIFKMKQFHLLSLSHSWAPMCRCPGVCVWLVFRHEDMCIQMTLSGFLAVIHSLCLGFFIAWWPCAGFCVCGRLTRIILCSSPLLLSLQDLLTVLCILIWEPCLGSEYLEDVQGPWWWASRDGTTTCHSHSPSSASPCSRTFPSIVNLPITVLYASGYQPVCSKVSSSEGCCHSVQLCYCKAVIKSRCIETEAGQCSFLPCILLPCWCR